MPRPTDLTECNQCGRQSSEAGPISTRGRCGDCQIANATASMRSINGRAGPHYDRWKAGMAAAARRILAELEVVPEGEGGTTSETSEASSSDHH